MRNDWLTGIKNHYIDTVDPENAIIKSAFRTALACAISILLAQLFGNIALSAWAGFATFAFVQNDTQELFFNRLRFLISVILVFTGLTFLGMLLSNQPAVFLISIPLVIFAGAYIACLGFSYFNAGAWALFLYILAGANPSSLAQASQIGITFLLCGVLSLAVCFGVFPTRPYQKIILNYRRILTKILLLFQHAPQQNQAYFTKFSAQLDQILALQEKNLSLHLESGTMPTANQTPIIHASKLLYQTSLLAKSTLHWQRLVSQYNHYADTQLEECRLLIQKALQSIIKQIKRRKPVDFAMLNTQLMHYRNSLTVLRKQELTKPDPDFSEFLDDATCFYHYLKILELLEAFGRDISQLQSRT